jgi:hypothetical protein
MIDFKSVKSKVILDWEQSESRHMSVGTIDINSPLLRPMNLFYTGGVANYTETSAAFYTEYNRLLKWMVEKYGVPEWAPILRVPNLSYCIRMLNTAQDINSVISVSDVFNSDAYLLSVSFWDNPISINHVYDENRNVLLSSCVQHDNSTRIEVIDLLRQPIWMASYRK